ncbi:MAG: hypothetical protein J6386_21855 [Candidatus Synoicihabitans palmerolidicus]|nr:hypothetical protein [Candidatus Synoicihabitans palmerolidicus]
MAAPNIPGALRRSLLIKVIANPAPSREDITSVIELTATKVVEALQAQSMTLYLESVPCTLILEGGQESRFLSEFPATNGGCRRAQMPFNG